MAELQPGAIFAGHRIEGIAGRGGFGVVYRATHLVLDHVVALKLISSGRAGDESFRERFKSESRIAVSIRHPNVVAVHNAGEEDGLLFVTMDFIDGTDLRGLLTREGRLKPETAVAIIEQVAAALDAAHEKGLVHRDIKPGNVLIDERNGVQHVYLTDFGLSKQMDATSGVTASGAFVGTLDYVAPEQIRGDRLDARTDVYALGCVMFELLSGDVPFASQQEKVAKIYAHLQEQPPELIDAAPEVPSPLSDVIWRAMSKAPDDRHPSAGDFARACSAALEGRKPSEPERSVGVGAAAPTQAFDVLAAAAAGASAAPDTAEAAEPELGETREARPSETAEVPPAETDVVPEASLPGETVAVPPPGARERSTQPDAPGRRREGVGRGRILAAVAVVAVLAVGAFALLGGGGDGGTAEEGGAGNRGGGSGGSGEAPAPGPVAEVAAKPVGLGIDAGVVWVSSRNGEELTRVDARDGSVLGKPIALGGQGEQVAFGEDGDAWVAVGRGDDAEGYVRRYDGDAKLVAEIPVGIEPRGIALGQEFAWVANRKGGTVSKVSVADNAVVDTLTVGTEPARAAAGNADGEGDAAAKGIWVTDPLNDSVARITEEGEAISTVAGVGDLPTGVLVTEDQRVFVAGQESSTLVRIDPEPDPVAGGSAGTVADEFPLGDCAPISLADGFDSIWATCADGGIVRVDPSNGDLAPFGEAGPDPEGIATDDQGVWVASGGAEDDDPGSVVLVDPGQVD
jgi:serine/threonine-protein kinase